MIKQLRTNMFLKKKDISERRKALAEYCAGETDFDLPFEEMSFDELAELFHWKPVYNGEGDATSFLYTAKDSDYIEYGDMDAAHYFLSSPEGSYIDILCDKEITRYAFDEFSYKSYSPGYDLAYVAADDDEKSSKIRDRLIFMNINDLAEVYNKWCESDGDSNCEKELHDIEEIETLWNNMSMREIISRYGIYYDEVGEDTLYFTVRHYDHTYPRYSFYNEEQASYWILLRLSKLIRFCAAILSDDQDVNHKRIFELLEK